MRACCFVASVCLFLGAGRIADAQPRNRVVQPATPLDARPGIADLRDRARKSDYEELDRRVAATVGADLPDAKLIHARTLLERGKYDDATKALAIAKTKLTLRPAVVLLEAELLMERGKLVDAERMLTTLRAETGEIGRAERVKLGEALIAQGKRDDANDPLHEVIDDYGEMPTSDAVGLAAVARAAHLLRSARDANKAFTESERADKTRVDTLLARATVFLEKYDSGHAEEVLRDALKITWLCQSTPE